MSRNTRPTGSCVPGAKRISPWTISICRSEWSVGFTTCARCALTSMGVRWASAGFCICPTVTSSRDVHDDHIFPLSLGGSNEEINHQLLDSKTNIQKSNELQFESVRAIDPKHLSARFRHVLQETDSMLELKRMLSEKYIQRHTGTKQAV